MTLDDSEFFHALLRAYIDSANDGIFVVCDEMKFHVANPLLQSWLGITEQELITHNQRIPITELIGNKFYAELFSQQFQQALSGKAVRFECLITPSRGSPRWLEISLNKVNLEAGEMFIGIARDITERKGLLDEIEYQTTHDRLTGLINRQEFERQLGAALHEPRTSDHAHVLLYLGLDKFKIVNDGCGHIAGNLFLQQIAERLKAKTRRLDTLARLGGDEFAVILRSCPLETAQQIADAYRETIRAFQFKWQDRVFELTASIGIAPLFTESDNAVEVLDHAEVTCQVAKDKGGNRVERYQDSEEFNRRRRESHWAAEIRAALAENRFQLYYQRIIPLTPHVSSQPHREVLLRMRSAQGEIIAPVEFLAAAEKYYLMPSIDRWVIQRLFSHHIQPGDQAGQWAINLSGASLNDEQFPAFLREQIAAHAVAPSALCFEITETIAIQNLQRAAAFVHELQAIGCRFALDDFGSGMSSFAYLRALTVDYLKIDGSLVLGIDRDPVRQVMVDAIHKVGQVLGTHTIAEFVENEHILATLREIGIDYAQGYGIHRPEAL